MPVQHAVLALLARGPSYGYEIKQTVEATLGPQWGQLNIGHVYQTLDRLQRDGAVTAGSPARGARADRVIYSITDAGRASLSQWLDAPAERSTGYRDEFFLKLAAAAWEGKAASQGVIRRQRAHLVALLHALSKAADLESTSALDSMLIEAARLHAEADLKLLEILDDRIERILKQALSVGGGSQTSSEARETEAAG